MLYQVVGPEPFVGRIASYIWVNNVFHTHENGLLDRSGSGSRIGAASAWLLTIARIFTPHERIHIGGACARDFENKLMDMFFQDTRIIQWTA